MEYYLSFDIGILNMAYCLLDKFGNIHKWGVFSINGGSTYEQKCRNLVRELDKMGLEKLPHPNDSLVILVEQQPKINAKMRVLEGSLMMYFIIKKMHNNLNHIKKIISYSPKHKLKCYKAQPGDLPIVLKCKKNTYYYRKKLSVEHCKRILPQNNPEWVPFFAENEKTKGDDLSDAALQGLSYIKYEI